MIIKESTLRKIVREELLETFGGSTEATEQIDQLRTAISDWSTINGIEPKKVVRQLMKDMGGAQSKRKPRWSRSHEYAQFLDLATRLGSRAKENLQSMYDTFVRNAPKEIDIGRI